MTQEDLIYELEEDFEKGIISVYKVLRGGFFAFASSFSNNDSLIAQCYHDAIIAFIEMWNKEKYDSHKGQLNTLIYTIGKNQLLKKLNKKSLEPHFIQNIYGLSCELDDIEDSELIQSLRKAIDQLGSKCQDVIKLFYYYNYSNEAIMQRLNYKNENTVKAHKSRCLKKLKDLVRSEIK